VGAAAGIAAGVVALSVAQVGALLVLGGVSPIKAVGDAAIALSPIAVSE